MKNKYLEDIGLSKYNYGVYKPLKDDPRKKKWKKQRKKYGFDVRECWNLDQTFIEWLYSHLKMYYESCKNVIDLNYGEHIIDYKNKSYTQEQAILFILESLKRYLIENSNSIASEEACENVVLSLHLWAEMIFMMWW